MKSRSPKMLTLSSIQTAADRIHGKIHETAVMTSTYIDHLTGRNVYFKCEHLQKTGSFKVRGALNKMLLLQKNGLSRAGVVTHSSGNHGQAVAWAAKQLDLEAVVVVPKDTSQVKIDAIENYGARLVLCDPTPNDRIQTCNQLANELEYDIIPSSDDFDIMAGQGTIGLEFIQQVPKLEAVLISVSGGGLCAGISFALKSINENIKIYCVEPEGKFLEKSLRAEERLWSGEPKFIDTIADGIRIERPGLRTFPYLVKYAEKNVFTVNDSDVINGIKLSFARLKQVVEGAAGACVQALIKHNSVIPHEVQHVGIILCGGNIDIDKLPWF